MSVPKEVTIVTVEEELPGIESYARRHDWKVEWNKDALALTFTGQHPNDGTKLQVVAASRKAWSRPKPTTCMDFQGSICY